MGHNGTVPQGLGHKGTGTQRDWDTMGLGHMAGPQQYRSTMGLGHNGTGTKRDRSTMGLGRTGQTTLYSYVQRRVHIRGSNRFRVVVAVTSPTMNHRLLADIDSDKQFD